MSTPVIGIVSPGAMGAALGRSWEAGGARVVTTVEGRSERTRILASGLTLLPTLRDVVAASSVVVSICPPGEAEACLGAILGAAAEAGATPLLADLNAISPHLVRTLAARAATAGLDLVDGAISGGPPGPGSDTIIYLSGPRADEIAVLETDGLRRRVVGDQPGTASAVKMCTAAIYKGTNALWTQSLRAAAELGVLDEVVDDLRDAYPDQVGRTAKRLAVTASKSGRFVEEMRQIAATQASVGLTPALYDALAEV
ncbi:MAG TPA: DUF1932 domain-containing protein, partial [Ornithinibacter sp.]|nr:DUF1932 domain-containing protein [Ornithinibacter sp.]